MDKRPRVEAGLIEPNETMKMQMVQHAMNASHEGSFMLDLVKSATLCLVPDGQNPDGSQRYAQLAPHQIIARAAEVTRLAFAELEAQGWQCEMPTIDSLRPPSVAERPGFKG